MAKIKSDNGNLSSYYNISYEQTLNIANQPRNNLQTTIT